MKQMLFEAIALVVLSVLMLVPAFAEGDRKDDPARSRTLIILRISETLDLGEDETLKLAGEYRRLDKRRHELVGERSVTAVALETALGREPQNEADIRRLTDQLLSIDKELILMPDVLFDSVQDMLNTDQRARLALLKIKLQRKISRERTRRDKHQKGGSKSKP